MKDLVIQRMLLLSFDRCRKNCLVLVGRHNKGRTVKIPLAR